MEINGVGDPEHYLGVAAFARVGDLNASGQTPG